MTLLDALFWTLVLLALFAAVLAPLAALSDWIARRMR